VARSVTCFRADRRRLVCRELAGLAVEDELQHLICAECSRVDEFVAAIWQNRMRIAASGDDLNRFRLDQSIFADRAHRKFVAAIRGREKVTPTAIR
jgi:hypothetical protein